jgi:hypothetical protein
MGRLIGGQFADSQDKHLDLARQRISHLRRLDARGEELSDSEAAKAQHSTRTAILALGTAFRPCEAGR